MNSLTQKRLSLHLLSYLFLSISILLVSCSDSDPLDEVVPTSEETDDVMEENTSDDDLTDENDPNTDIPKEEVPDDTETVCTDPSKFIFQEKDGLIHIEFENAKFSGDWELQTSDTDHTGEGYMVWTGNQFLNAPGNGLTTFKIKITTPGTYRFVWRSSVITGTNGTDHNDTWLRFNDADDFYGEKSGGSIVYPKDTGKAPNPNGASSDGWFKIYRSGNDLGFKWQSSTSDNDGHGVYVKFDSSGIYTMEISARSSGHAIDRFVLFNDAYTQNQATAPDNVLNEISCSN